jgi:hypothetical protein
VHRLAPISVVLGLLLPNVWLTAPLQPEAVWFDFGHRLVAEVAESRFTDHTRAAVRDLLAGQSPADASLWADRIRSQRRDTSPLHYVNIPLIADAYDPVRDCPDGRCVIGAVDSFQRVLASPSAPRSERVEALRFLLHLIGDLHQPLHVADNQDKGGNNTQVRLGGRGTNLHKAWDGEMIETLATPEPEYLARLKRRMATLDLASFERGTVVEWAMEGHAIAQSRAYRVPKGRHLDSSYVQRAVQESDLALIKAGVRLAAVLNRALLAYQPSGNGADKADRAGIYSDAEAIGHVGEQATVVGTVVSVHTSRSGNTFLNFGADYPRQTFTAALLDPHHPQAARLVELKGKRVRVHGLIRLYHGQPEIVIQEPSQVVPLE